MPDVSKDEFRTRLSRAVNGLESPRSTQESQNPAVVSDGTAAATREAAPTPIASSASSQSPPQQRNINDASMTAQPMPQDAPRTMDSPAKKELQDKTTQKSAPPKPRQSMEVKKEALNDKREKKPAARQKAIVSADDESELKRPVARGPPSQYRLQVRLFDGSSVRSSFTPTQTIERDVRPWLDEKMGDDKRPYNLKHILTPLPSRTLSVAEESQTLQDLSLGSTANLVMVPVQTYTEAYASASSLPVRGASAIFNVVSSVASTTAGFVGSLVGYGPSAPTTETSSTPDHPETSQQSRPTGPNIRTLRDQQGRGNSQLYNGNQARTSFGVTSFGCTNFAAAQLRASRPGQQRGMIFFIGRLSA